MITETKWLSGEKQIAAYLNVSLFYFRRIRKKFRLSGNKMPIRKEPGVQQSSLKCNTDELDEWVKKHFDIMG